MNKVFITITLILLLVLGVGIFSFSNKSSIVESKNVFPQAQVVVPKKNFSALEPVVVTVDLKKDLSSNAGFWSNVIKKAFAADTPVSVEILDSEGNTNDGIPVEVVEKGEGVYEVKAIPPSSFEPGKYTMSILLSEGLAKREIKQDFTWGVLAINPNKSVYRPGETAKLAIAVLDDKGEMVCDTEVSLTIIDPKGVSMTMDSKNSTIRVNPVCHEKKYTLEPDYEARYTTTVPGEYKMNLTATTPNGTFTINDAFVVEESPIFEIERESITRIYPAFVYPMRITVKANRDFEGSISELVPDNFTLRPVENEGISGGTKIIQPIIDDTVDTSYTMLTWDVSMEKGDTIQLGYGFETPKVSPQFYLVGPLQFKEKSANNASPTIAKSLTDGLIYHESRQWQLAIDAANDGSGTNTVSTTTGTVSTTGNTYTFTYTTGDSAATGSGTITIEEPAQNDWVVPQTSNSGAAGYLTVDGTSTGTLGDVLDNADVNTNWVNVGTNACGGAAPTRNTQGPVEGPAFLACAVGNVAAANGFGKNISSANWTNYTTAGAWIQTSVSITTSDLAFAYDDTASLASPIERIATSNPATINAGPWTWVTWGFGVTTRTAVVSFGFLADSASGIDNRSVFADYILIGPGTPTVSGTSPWVITAPIVTMPATTGTIKLVYGSGGGAGGVTNSAINGVHTFRTKSKMSSNNLNTLEVLASSPTVTLGEANSIHFEGLNMEAVNIN